jgi:hypothetical protein
MAALGRLQPKAGPPRSLLRGTIAIGPIGLRPWQAAEIEGGDGRLCQRRLYHQGVEHVLSLTAIVGVGSGHNDPQGHGASVAG